MTPTEVADYMRTHYSREEYLLLTLVSSSLLMSNWIEKNSDRIESDSQEIRVVAEVLESLRESLSESELLAVSVMLAEIDRLRDE